MPELFSSFR